jgi:geranylgeranyl diphosphate synthase type I
MTPRILWTDYLAHNKTLGSKLQLIDEELFKVLMEASSEPKILYDAAIHPIKSGGKRLRPLLVLLACEAVTGDFMKALSVAVAIEIIHTSSLIHDDLIDQDSERRGAPTVHMKYDNNMAILSGDILISKAMQMISDNSSIKVRRAIAQACIEMCEGECLDVSFKKSPETVTEENYLKMVGKKTGALVRAAAECGGIIGGGTRHQVRSLAKYGEFLGLSLQLRDDVHEILTTETGPEASLNNCLLGQGSNLVLIHSFRNSDKSQQNLLRSLFTSNVDCHRLRDATNVFENSMSIQHVERLSERFEKEAKEAIIGMNFRNQRILEDLAGYVARN